jgi:hypothetical protein
MTELKQEEIQQEFFGFSAEPKKPDRLPGISKPQKPILISTSTEQIILVSIIFILASCFIFFLGVIRGKSLGEKVQRQIAAPQAVVQPVQSAAKQVVVKTTSVKPQNAAPAQTFLTAKPSASSVKSAEVKSQRVAAPTTKSALTTLNLNKPYTIQLTTSKKKDLAEKEVDAIQKKGYFSFIIPSGDYFQVCVGQYATKDEAKNDLKIFGSKYKDCYLRRR